MTAAAEDRHDEDDLLGLSQLLYWRWDPIGINDGFPAAADEYADYARELLPRLRAGATADEVTRYLEGVETDAMGLRPGAARRHDVGAAVVSWFASRMRLREALSRARGGSPPAG